MQKRKVFTTKALVTVALLTALGTLTQSVPLFEMPMGGSVTLFSMLFIASAGWLLGPAAGAAGGLAASLLSMLFHPPWIIPLSPADGSTLLYVMSQFAFDYIFPFIALGMLSGFFKSLAAGYTAAVLGRFLFHVLSGVIFFSEAARGFVPWLSGAPLVWFYSVSYNASFLFVEGAVTVAVLLLSPVRKMFRDTKSRLSA